MSLVINYRKVLNDNFSEELYWYMEEFMLFFGKNSEKYTQQEYIFANHFLTNASQLLDVFSDQTYLKEFTLFLQNIGIKYPEFF